MIPAFSVSRVPNILFGEKSLKQVPSLAASYGQRALIVTGSRSFRETQHWEELKNGLRQQGLDWGELRIAGEPSPQIVDNAVHAMRSAGIKVVIGIGGGSVLDAAKAVAGLLPHGNSVMEHLEGVGPELPYMGPSTPYIAVPTTAGTGSEATKNAVLSIQGAHGFKKSFRHELLVPRYAVVDPDLLATCPPALVAANGMDAFTQLLESFVSSRSNLFTDALVLSGLEAVRGSLIDWYMRGPDAAESRRAMAYAALLSGITLAQAGLGSVHGLAAPLGAFFPIPHGVVCGTLVAAATEINIRALRERASDNLVLEKYARVGRLLSGDNALTRDMACEVLVSALHDWTRRLELPRLGAYGVRAENFAAIVASCRGSSMKTNPIVLTDQEIGKILAARL